MIHRQMSENELERIQPAYCSRAIYKLGRRPDGADQQDRLRLLCAQTSGISRVSAYLLYLAVETKAAGKCLQSSRIVETERGIPFTLSKSEAGTNIAGNPKILNQSFLVKLRRARAIRQALGSTRPFRTHLVPPGEVEEVTTIDADNLISRHQGVCYRV